MNEAVRRYIERSMGPANAIRKAFENNPKFAELPTSALSHIQRYSIQSKFEKNLSLSLSLINEPKFIKSNERSYLDHFNAAFSNPIDNTFAYQKYKTTTEKIFNFYLERIQSKHPNLFNENEVREFVRGIRNQENTLINSLYSISLKGIKVESDDNQETAIEEEITKVDEYLENEEHKEQVNEFLVEITEGAEKGKIKSLEDYLKQFSNFIHNKLLKGSPNVSVQTVHNLNNLIVFVFTNIIIPIVIDQMLSNEDGNAKKIYQHIQINRTVNNYFQASDTICYTLKSTNIYLRNSTKTKCLGKIEKDVTLIVKATKPKWVFVEVQIEKIDKKTKEISYPIIRGWVMKDCLEA